MSPNDVVSWNALISHLACSCVYLGRLAGACVLCVCLVPCLNLLCEVERALIARSPIIRTVTAYITIYITVPGSAMVAPEVSLQGQPTSDDCGAAWLIQAQDALPQKQILQVTTIKGLGTDAAADRRAESSAMDALLLEALADFDDPPPGVVHYPARIATSVSSPTTMFGCLPIRTNGSEGLTLLAHNQQNMKRCCSLPLSSMTTHLQI